MVDNDESVKTIEERKVMCVVDMFYKTIRTAISGGVTVDGRDMAREELINFMYENIVRQHLNGESAFDQNFYQGYVIGRFDPETAAELSISNYDEMLDITEQAINIIGGSIA